LAEIWRYYGSAAGADVADNIVRQIENTARILDNHPLAGSTRDEIRPGPRSIASRPYVLFYRVRSDVAEVVRVLHGRRDIDQVFAQQSHC
jgi:toxin ParE1/3/4